MKFLSTNDFIYNEDTREFTQNKRIDFKLSIGDDFPIQLRLCSPYGTDCSFKRLPDSVTYMAPNTSRWKNSSGLAGDDNDHRYNLRIRLITELCT